MTISKVHFLTAPQETLPLADWLYTSNVELGRYKEAEESLNLVDASVKHRRWITVTAGRSSFIKES